MEFLLRCCAATQLYTIPGRAIGHNIMPYNAMGDTYHTCHMIHFICYIFVSFHQTHSPSPVHLPSAFVPSPSPVPFTPARALRPRPRAPRHHEPRVRGTQRRGWVKIWEISVVEEILDLIQVREFVIELLPAREFWTKGFKHRGEIGHLIKRLHLQCGRGASCF